jgi:hypothetical protein
MIKNFNSFINESNINDSVFLFVKLSERLEHLDASDAKIQRLVKEFDTYNVYLKYSAFNNEARLVTDIIICCIESEDQVPYIVKTISEIIKINVDVYKSIPFTDGNILIKYIANRT